MSGDLDTNKEALRAELLAIVQSERDKLIAAQKLSADGVTHADSRSEGDKDTRATEASYIARGQAQRAEALIADADRIAAMAIRRFTDDDPIALSAVVVVDDERLGKRCVFVAPAGGGTEIGDHVHVTTPRSPLGKLLIGARCGDFLQLERGGDVSEIEIVDVC
jgi:transcription elongation GreA/GreB family factor